MRAACVATVSTNGEWIVCGCSDGKLRVWDAESQTYAVETNDHHAREVSTLDVSTDSSMVASGSLDGSVIVWSITTGQRLAGPFNLDQGNPGNVGKLSSVRFSRCGRHLAGCTNILNPPNHQHGAVYVLDIHDNQLTQRVVVALNSYVTEISWSVDVTSPRILAGLEESLAVIDPSRGELDCRKPIPGFRHLSANGKFIVSGTWQDGVRFWDATTFREIGPILPSCLPLAISPNNFSLVGISRNAGHRLSIWDLSDILPKCYIIRVCNTSFFSCETYRDHCWLKDDEISEILPSPSTAMTTHSTSHALGFEATGKNFDIMLSKIQLSPNPEVYRKC